MGNAPDSYKTLLNYENLGADKFNITVVPRDLNVMFPTRCHLYCNNKAYEQ